MIWNRLPLLVAVLLFAGSHAYAQDCKPVETAPGIKSVPAGCNKISHPRDGVARTGSIAPAPKAAPAPKPLPAAKPSALFPGAAPGSIAKFGDTEVRIGGSVRYEYGYGR